uniref:BHLH domain-containing protein n=1 Tax=Vitis vinifera TaxID=29760 RepID=F6HHT4_VITVI
MPRRGSKVPTLTRNMLERNRRMFTKDLLSKLASLINPTPRAPKWKSLDLLDQATAHVKQLEQRVEMLKQRKQLLESSTDETAGMRC